MLIIDATVADGNYLTSTGERRFVNNKRLVNSIDANDSLDRIVVCFPDGRDLYGLHAVEGGDLFQVLRTCFEIDQAIGSQLNVSRIQASDLVQNVVVRVFGSLVERHRNGSVLDHI